MTRQCAVRFPKAVLSPIQSDTREDEDKYRDPSVTKDNLFSEENVFQRYNPVC